MRRPLSRQALLDRLEIRLLEAQTAALVDPPRSTRPMRLLVQGVAEVVAELRGRGDSIDDTD